jgi:hypothetical protein
LIDLLGWQILFLDFGLIGVFVGSFFLGCFGVKLAGNGSLIGWRILMIV